MDNNHLKGTQIPGVIIFFVFIVFPPIGILLLVLKYMIQPKAKDTEQMNNDDSWDEHANSQSNQIVRKRKTNIETFDHTITIKCPNCLASNFTDHLPMSCEYCGEIITKKVEN